jgi:hypothetical protein
MRLVIPLEMNVEFGCIAEFQNLSTLRAGLQRISIMGRNEDAVAFAQRLLLNQA